MRSIRLRDLNYIFSWLLLSFTANAGAGGSIAGFAAGFAQVEAQLDVDVVAKKILSQKSSHQSFQKKSFNEALVRNSQFNFLNASESDFSGTRFTSTFISKSDFTKSKFRGATFDLLEISNSNMTGVFGEGLRVERSQLSNLDLRGAHLQDAIFVRSTCRACDFRGADLTGATFILCDLETSLYDEHTHLPFSKSTAEKMGLRFETK